MRPRNWQQECVDAAVSKFLSGKKTFFVQATPGAGKTYMAAVLASELLQRNLIDYVICFSPSITVSNSIRNTFESVLKRGMSGLLGDVGAAYTYQYLSTAQAERFKVLSNSRVFVIFDEIHHASGDNDGLANSWGREILTKVSNRAAYILSMTGTPWRSDQHPITLATYIMPKGLIGCDYTYGMMSAIRDSVCRAPEINLIDNDQLLVDGKPYSSIESALLDSELRYDSFLDNEVALNHILSLASKRLRAVRENHGNAGGLIVAKSVEHALYIYQILSNKLNQTAVIVTYLDPNSQKVIEEYRLSNVDWIVSVAMISEGTDIPRLRVCVHLSNVRTELFFRQVLGRVLRLIPNQDNDIGWLYTFSEPDLVEFATRVQDDIPKSELVVVKRSIGEITDWDLASVTLKTRPRPEEQHITSTPNNELSWGSCSDIDRRSHVIASQLKFSLEGSFRQQVYSVLRI
jgi:superfamily II DNA or RNA helicase|tara:strand:+ start:9777 stop:11159 length:1383 start_codon:yes stop_codon:yes gene_type:complete